MVDLEIPPVRRRARVEDAALRSRARARALRGRIFVDQGKAYLIVGDPSLVRLVEGLRKRKRHPADLGFEPDQFLLVTTEILSDRARALQRWRAFLEEEKSKRQRNRRERARIEGWESEIAELTPRAAQLREILADPCPRFDDGCVLDRRQEGLPAAKLRAIADGRPVPEDIASFARIILWLDGEATLDRFLETVSTSLVDRDTAAAREAHREIDRRFSSFIAVWNEWNLPLDRPGRRRNLPTSAREWIRSLDTDPHWAAFRVLVATAPKDLSLPARNRDIDFKVLAARCKAALEEYPKDATPSEMARLACLLILDRHARPPAWPFVRDQLNDDVLLRLQIHAVKPGFTALVNHLPSLGKFHVWQLGNICHFISRHPEGFDWDWCRDRLEWSVETEEDCRNAPVVRKVDGWLTLRGRPLEAPELTALWEATREPAGRVALEALAEFLDGLGAGPLPGQVVSGVRGIVMMLCVPGAARGPIRDHFRVWADPPRGQALPDDWPRAGEGLTGVLKKLFYYLRAADKPEELPKSIRKPLRAVERMESERRFLAELGEAITPRQRMRLEYLSTSFDPFRDEDKLERQAREVCAIAALDAIQNRLRLHCEDWWRTRLRLPGSTGSIRWEELWELMAWAERLPKEDRPRFDRILEAYDKHGPAYRQHLPFNRAWLDRVSPAMEAWFHPDAASVELPDKSFLRIQPARDPREVCLMGSWFKTCLRLSGGENHLSVLANAGDANKAVLLACVGDDRPVGRLLVAIAPEKGMIQYGVYVRDGVDEAAVSNALQCYAAASAARCGWPLLDRGVPENLGGGFWYDDGVTDWPAAAKESWRVARPDGERCPVEAVSPLHPEWIWDAVSRSESPLIWESFLARICPEELRPAATAFYIRKFPTRAADRIKELCETMPNGHGHGVAEQLAKAGCFQGAADPARWIQRRMYADALLEHWDRVWPDLPDAAVLPTVRRFILISRAFKGNRREDFDSIRPDIRLGLLPLRLLMQFYHALARVHSSDGDHRLHQGIWPRIFLLSYLRDRDPSVLREGLAGDDRRLQHIILDICDSFPVPHVSRIIRKWACRSHETSIRNRCIDFTARTGPSEIAEATRACDPRLPLRERVSAASAAWRGTTDKEARNCFFEDWSVAFKPEEKDALPLHFRNEMVAGMAERNCWQFRAALRWVDSMSPEEASAVWRSPGGLPRLEAYGSTNLFETADPLSEGSHGFRAAVIAGMTLNGAAERLRQLGDSFHPIAFGKLAIEIKETLARENPAALEALRTDLKGSKSARLRKWFDIP